MITIMPADRAADKAELAALGIPAGTDAMLLRSGGAVEGWAAFVVQSDTVELLQVRCAEPLLAEGLIRAVLNTGDCRGAVTGLCRDAAAAGVPEGMLKRLEFARGDQGWQVSLEAFFRAGCPSAE